MGKSNSADLLIGDIVFIRNPVTQTSFRIQAKLPDEEESVTFIFFKVVNRTDKSITVRVAPRRKEKRLYKSVLVDRYRFVFKDGKWRNGQGYLKPVAKIRSLSKFLKLFANLPFQELRNQIPKNSEGYDDDYFHTQKRNFEKKCREFRDNLRLLTSPMFVRKRMIYNALQDQWDLDWSKEPKIVHFFLSMICDRYAVPKEVDAQGFSKKPVWSDLIMNVSRLQSENFARLVERYPDTIQKISSRLYELFANCNNVSEIQQSNFQILAKAFPPTYPVIPLHFVSKIIEFKRDWVLQYCYSMSSLPIFNSPDLYRNLNTKVWSDSVIYLPLFIFRQYYVDSNRRKKAMSLTVRLENLQFLAEKGVQPRICPKVLISAGTVETFEFYEKIGLKVPLDVIVQFLYSYSKADESRIRPILLFLKPLLTDSRLLLDLKINDINTDMLELLMDYEFDQLIQLILDLHFNSYHLGSYFVEAILKRGYRMSPTSLQKAYHQHLQTIAHYPLEWITPLPEEMDWLYVIRQQKDSKTIRNLVQQFVENGLYPNADLLKKQIFELPSGHCSVIPIEELQTDPFFRFSEEETKRLMLKFVGECWGLASLCTPFPDYWQYVSQMRITALGLIYLGVKLNIPIRECDLQSLHKTWRNLIKHSHINSTILQIASLLNNLSPSPKLVDFRLCHSENRNDWECEQEYAIRKHRRFLMNYFMIGLGCDYPIIEAIHLSLSNLFLA